VIYDPASDPSSFALWPNVCSRFDRIRLLFGCYMSSTRKASCRWSKATVVCCLYPTLYEGLNIRGTASTPVLRPNQNSLQLAKFLLATYGNRFCWSARTTLSLRIQSPDGRLRRAGPGQVLDEIMFR